jgi:APA family basic amino acid/polyamine antiporter
VAAGSSPRALGFAELFALALNGIVGVGIFFAPAAIAERSGAALVPAAFLAAALAFAPSVLVYVRLAELLPHDGGPAAHARRAFGETAGFIMGAVGLFAAFASTAAVLRALGEVIAPGSGRLAALALLVGFALVVARGLRLSARAWTALTALKIAAILALLVAGLRAPSLPFADGGRAALLAWPGFGSVLIAAFCFQGFEVTALVAGQGRAARPMLAAFVVAALLYALVVAGPGGLAATGWASHVVTLSSLGIAFAMVAMTPRYVPAMLEGARGSHALLVTVAVVGALVLAGARAELFEVATLAVVAQYTASALALLKLRERPTDALLACGAVGTSAALGSAATLREAAVFVAVLFAAAALSRTVTGKSRARHRSPLDV